jgi:transposase InsO family protein
MNLSEVSVPETSLVFESGAWHRVNKEKPLDLPALWRGIAEEKGLSTEARLRLEWMLFFRAGHSVTTTCKHFGISRRVFYKWKPLFDTGGVEALETKSTAPLHTRQWEVSTTEEYRIKKLRLTYLHWGKHKLKALYEREYHEEISTWKIERVIRKHQLFPKPVVKQKLDLKKKKAKKRLHIQDLVPESAVWNLVHLDTIVIYWGSEKRYILTALDHFTRVGYARMYTTKSSRSAADFLKRLHCLMNHDLLHVHTDNGSEFALEFEKALEALKATHWYSRPHTPKDNARLENFNGTLQREWLNDGNFTPRVREFNINLTNWLVTYNFVRPHQSLDYATPFSYLEATQTKTKV